MVPISAKYGAKTPYDLHFLSGTGLNRDNDESEAPKKRRVQMKTPAAAGVLVVIVWL